MSAAQEQVFVTPASDPAGAHRIAYREWNVAGPAAPKLLMAHGLTRNGHDFDWLAEALSARYHIVTPDVAGRGKSEWLAEPLHYHYGTYASDLSRLLDALGWRQVHWIGTSMGGILGMMMAAGQPERIASLVLNDIGSLVPRQALSRIIAYAGTMRDYPQRAEAEADLRKIGAPWGFTEEAQWRHFIDHSIEPSPKGGWRLACDPLILEPLRVQTDNFRAIEDGDLNPWWLLVRCPVLLLRGEYSDILPREMADQMRQAEGKDVTFHEYEKTGHAPHLMNSEQIGDITDWLLAKTV